MNVATRRQQELNVSALKLRHVVEEPTKRRQSAAVDPAKCCRGRGRLDTRPSAVRLLRICRSQQWWARPCSGLRRSWPGVRRCYAANNLAGIQGSNLTTTSDKDLTSRRKHKEQASTFLRRRRVTGDHALFVQTPPRPPPPTNAHRLPLCWHRWAQLTAPISMRAVSGSIPPPRASVYKRVGT
jgi:hypothetical protein